LSVIFVYSAFEFYEERIATSAMDTRGPGGSRKKLPTIKIGDRGKIKFYLRNCGHVMKKMIKLEQKI
jgi:hypothetical protein